MGATGVLGFERMLTSMSRLLDFSDVVFVAISDDFFRPLWRPLVRDDELRLCADTESDEECAEHGPIAQLIQPDASADALVVRAREIHAERARTRGIAKSLLRSSRLLVFARDLFAARLREMGRDAVVEQSFAALGRIRAAHPEARIRFVHVPDKYETQRVAYDLQLAARLAGMGIEYLPVLGTCPWSTQLYFARDNHPDAAGYEALAACVARMLELAPASARR